MSDESADPDRSGTPYRRRTVIGALAAGAGAVALGTGSARAQEGTDGQTQPDWLPAAASEAHVAVLSGYQADESTRASGCAHVTPLDEENTVVVDLVLEDVQCLTQAHIHEGERGEDGPIVAPILEITEEIDGSGDDAPITAEPDAPIIAGATVDDETVVENLLANPGEYYVNVHTVHNPAGEIRGQIRGFDRGQETDVEPEPASFAVSNLDPQDGTVVQGDGLDVSARISNEGDVAATRTVELRIDGDVLADRTVELGCRSSTTVTFDDVDTSDLDPGEYEHEVASGEDAETGSFTVLSPPEFDVSELDPQDAIVTQGEALDVSATVENVGEATGAGTVQFRVDDDTLAEQEVDLDGGASQSVTFEAVDTSPLDPGEYEHGVFTAGDSATGTLTVEAGTDEPGTETPGTEEPETGTPGTEEPGTDTPGTEEPGTGTPGTGDPGTETPGTEEPGTETPGTEAPGTETPGTEGPGTSTPGTEDGA